MIQIPDSIIPIGHTYIRGSVLEKGNIFGLDVDKSTWAKNLNLPRKAEYTFFAGCGYQLMRYTGGMMGAIRTAEKMGMGMGKVIGVSKAFGKVGIDLTRITAKVTAAGKEDPYTKVLTNAVSVLNKLGIDLGYLYEDEPCCGSPLYYSGFVDDYIENAQKTYELLRSLGVKKIVGVIPACTGSLKNLYPSVVDGYDIEVKHFIEVVAQRLRETKIKPKLKEKMVVTYHDPCQLSRYLNLVEEPREVMSMIGGLELREPEAMQKGEWSTCCGGGGGMEVCFPELSERMVVRRVEELLTTGAPVIATSCPACVMQLLRGINKVKAEIEVIDLAEILDAALEERPLAK
jgi:heterodisulfide reductase subunit B